MYLSRAGEVMHQHGDSFYSKISKGSAEFSKYISLDAPRLAHQHDSGFQQMLKNVIISYLNYERDLQYVPAIMVIVVKILEVVNDEESTFWIFRQIMREYHWKHMIS